MICAHIKCRFTVENTNVIVCLWFKLQTDAGAYRCKQAGTHTHTHTHTHCSLLFRFTPVNDVNPSISLKTVTCKWV